MDYKNVLPPHVRFRTLKSIGISKCPHTRQWFVPVGVAHDSSVILSEIHSVSHSGSGKSIKWRGYHNKTGLRFEWENPLVVILEVDKQEGDDVILSK